MNMEQDEQPLPSHGAETPPRRLHGSSSSDLQLTGVDETTTRRQYARPSVPRLRTDFSVGSASMQSVASGLIVVASSQQKENLEGLVVKAAGAAGADQGDENGDGVACGEPNEMILAEIKGQLDKTLTEIREQNRRDFEKVLSVLQQESTKRLAWEARLHSQLLFQSETMVALEMKLLRLEAKVERKEAATAIHRQQQLPQQQQTRRPTTMATISRIDESSESSRPLNVISSGASLASGVTATSFLEDDDGENSHGSDSTTPTQSSRPQIGVVGGTSLESILQNPAIVGANSGSGDVSVFGTSTARATRGFMDDNSSLATSVTNSTLASTVLTSTTRGTHVVLEEPEQQSRSRSQSPLTIQSSTAGDNHTQLQQPQQQQQQHIQLQASSSSIGGSTTSILSNVAVAPRHYPPRGSRYGGVTDGNRQQSSHSNRVVSFTSGDMRDASFLQAINQEDSITMPDELDNLSEVAETFATNARVWRDEYEARLDALQKRWSGD